MNYEDGVKLLPLLEGLKSRDLIKDKEWQIIHIALLPSNIDTLTAYTNVLDWTSNGNWMPNGVNHNAVYNSGVYLRREGGHFDDELTFYVILKNRTSVVSVEYKSVWLSTLILEGQIRKEDIPNSVLQYL